MASHGQMYLGIFDLSAKELEVHFHASNEISVDDAKNMALLVKKDFEKRKGDYSGGKFKYNGKSFEIDYDSQNRSAFVLKIDQ